MVLEGPGDMKFIDGLGGCGISPDGHEAGFAFILLWQALTPLKREVARHWEGLPVSPIRHQDRLFRESREPTEI